MALAGIDSARWTDTDKSGRQVERRMFKYTCHSMRDRYATTMLSTERGHSPEDVQTTGGWKNSQVIYTRYVGASKRTLDNIEVRVQRPEGHVTVG
jgi:hypothetical protein